MLSVGYIGLGLMGKSMARNILKAGFPLVVHNRSRGAVDELAAAGAIPASSPVEVARQVDVVVCAQASMTALLPDLGETPVPVLTSPRLGVQHAVEVLAQI